MQSPRGFWVGWNRFVWWLVRTFLPGNANGLLKNTVELSPVETFNAIIKVKQAWVTYQREICQ